MEELRLNILVETDSYVYGKSEYYGEYILINKANKKIYEIVPCHDVCVCVIDIAQTYDNLDGYGFMFPFYIVNSEAFDGDDLLCEDLYSEILDWEENPKDYLLNSLNYME